MTIRAVARAATALTAVVLVLAGCSSNDAVDASPTPTPTPTPASVVWAGAMCSDMTNVKAAVSAFGRNLDYDVSSDRSALEQIDRQLRIQVLSVADSIDKLVQTARTVPVDFAAATTFANDVAKSGADAKAAGEEVVGRLDAARAESGIVGIGREILAALVAARAAFSAGQAFVSTITSATSGASGELREAFDAAPECADLEASPSASG